MSYHTGSPSLSVRRLLTSMVTRWLAIAAVALIASCAPAAYSPIERKDNTTKLADLVVEKYPAVTRTDADHFATKAFDESVKMREEFDLVLAPWLNNVLVNFRIHKRGYCYHWSQDLYLELSDHLPPGMRMTLVDSYRGHPSKEHNTISFHASNQPWSKGILLDPWTYGGNLDVYQIEGSDVPWKYYAEHP